MEKGSSSSGWARLERGTQRTFPAKILGGWPAMETWTSDHITFSILELLCSVLSATLRAKCPPF